MPCVLCFGGVKLGMKIKFTGKVGPVFLRKKNEGCMGFRDLRLFNLAMLGKQG